MKETWGALMKFFNNLLDLFSSGLFLHSNLSLYSSSIWLCKGSINRKAMICSVAMMMMMIITQHCDGELCSTLDISDVISYFNLIHS